MPHAFVTIDTEFAWRHHVAGWDAAAIHARSVEPAGVGLSAQLALLARHGLKATFFVDPMPALVHGIDWVRRMVEPVLAAGAGGGAGSDTKPPLRLVGSRRRATSPFAKRTGRRASTLTLGA